MNFVQIKMTLGAVLDKVSGEAGLSERIVAANKRSGTVAQFEALTVALAEKTNTPLPLSSLPPSVSALIGGEGIAGSFKPKRGATEDAAGGALAEYERLRSVDPRAAGQYYAEHGDAVQAVVALNAQAHLKKLRDRSR
jgi:hypothetical protein